MEDSQGSCPRYGPLKHTFWKCQSGSDKLAQCRMRTFQLSSKRYLIMLKLDSWCNIINSGQNMILLFPVNSMPSWRLSEPNILSLPTLQSSMPMTCQIFNRILVLLHKMQWVFFTYIKKNVELELSVWTILKI